MKVDGEERIVICLNSVLNKNSYPNALRNEWKISASYWMCDTVFSGICNVGSRDSCSGMWQNLSQTS